MTDTPHDAAMTRSKQELARQVVDCNARIEQLEAAMREAGDIYREATSLARARIEALEAALREIADAPAWGAPDRWETTPFEVRERARAALAPESK